MKYRPDCPYTLYEKIRENKPILFLDYDGTLVNIFPDPELAVADDKLKSLLKNLKELYEVYIVTGRAFSDMKGLLGIDINLIALHGAVGMIDGTMKYFVKDYDHYVALCNELEIREQRMKDRFQGLRIYNKKGNLLFHYGRVPVAEREALFGEVESLGKIHVLSVYRGKLIIELRIPGVNKGRTISLLRNGRNALIAGDDTTDEEAFENNKDALKIAVGRELKNSDCVLPNPEEMRKFLSFLIQSAE